MGGPDPAETYRIMMEERQRQTQRAVAETLRRRFEEHKDEGRLPASAAARPGVVRATTPEERAALDSGKVGGISAAREAEVLAAWHTKEKT